MSTPTALRDEGMTAAENGADPRVLLHVDAVIAEAIESGEPFSANSIRDRLPVTSRGLVGARVRAAAMRKEPRLEQVGEVRSTLPGTHAKKIAVWRKAPTPIAHRGWGANAEDCPACVASPVELPYPWVCPGDEVAR